MRGTHRRRTLSNPRKQSDKNTFASPCRPNMSALRRITCSTAHEVHSLMSMFDNVMEDGDGPSKMENHGKIVRTYGFRKPKPNLFTGPISRVLLLLMQLNAAAARRSMYGSHARRHRARHRPLRERHDVQGGRVGPRGTCVHTTQDRTQYRRRVRERPRGIVHVGRSRNTPLALKFETLASGNLQPSTVGHHSILPILRGYI